MKAPPEFITIPAGSFTMGCTADDRFGNPHELPRTPVDIAAFELSTYPVSDPETGLPRIHISWDEAQSYCASLGSSYRLPTEAEWEYACRAGTTTIFPTGDLPDPESVNFLYDEAGNRTGAGELKPIAWGKPNAFGLHDMLGNVCEWVADPWTPDYASPVPDPHMKVIRGGGWDYLPRLLRPSWRDCAPTTTRRDNLGFRIARDL